eukprot:m.200470 g.200470  ORF g.200470 m.200470 type:complete len:52 (+) comp17054_c0_seq8:250-405(+)
MAIMYLLRSSAASWGGLPLYDSNSQQWSLFAGTSLTASMPSSLLKQLPVLL